MLKLQNYLVLCLLVVRNSNNKYFIYINKVFVVKVHQRRALYNK